MKKILLACAAVLAFITPASAQLRVEVPVEGARGKGCYSPTEAEADQGIRIHSELMVIALNCQHMTPRGWKNFYLQYQEITARFSPVIAGYETTLIDYYGRNGRSNAERALHDLRTIYANRIATDAARMRPDVFCATYAPRLPKVEKMSVRDFQAWASDVRPDHPVSEPLCR